MADRYELLLTLVNALLIEQKETNRHLRVLARQIACHNAAEIPDILRRIDANTRERGESS
jgi:hypothetical protein